MVSDDANEVRRTGGGIYGIKFRVIAGAGIGNIEGVAIEAHILTGTVQISVGTIGVKITEVRRRAGAGRAEVELVQTGLSANVEVTTTVESKGFHAAIHAGGVDGRNSTHVTGEVDGEQICTGQTIKRTGKRILSNIINDSAPVDSAERSHIAGGEVHSFQGRIATRKRCRININQVGTSNIRETNHDCQTDC